MINNYWTKYEVEKLKELYPKTSWEVILKEIPNRSIKSITYKAFCEKLKRKKLVFYRKGTLEPLLGKTNESYYWIGFILADGYFNHSMGKFSITLSIKDLNHLKKLEKYLSTNIKIYNKKDMSVVCFLGVCQKNICKKIIKKFDFKPRKTYNPPSPKILDKMTDEQFLSFLCGLIDGDGYIFGGNKNYNVCKYIKILCHGSYLDFFKLMEKRLYKILNIELKNSYIRIDKYGYAGWLISKQRVLKIFKLKLLQLNIPYLERKWNKIDEKKITGFVKTNVNS